MRFHQGVPSPSPSKPLPLLAAAEAYSYTTWLMPWEPGLLMPASEAPPARVRAAGMSTKIGWISRIRLAHTTWGFSTLRPRNSGVRPTIRPVRNTASSTNTRR